MVITVERVSKYGVQANGKWHNPSKFLKVPIDLTALRAGDEVELNAKGFITAVVKQGGGAMPTSATTAADQAGAQVNPEARAKTYTYQGKDSPSVRMEIARGTAVKAVLGSVILFEIYRPSRDETGKVTGEFKPQEIIGDLKTLIEQVTNYIATGAYDKELPVTAASLLKDQEVPF